jgi:pyruvate,water dikinase
MMDTYHYLRDPDEIIRHIRMCWASLWTSRAALNRVHKGIDHHLGLIAPVVQKMVDPEVAGIMFTANPITGSREEIVIESNWGLGESVVSGKSMNDFFMVGKDDVSIKTRKIAKKTVMVCFDRERGSGRKETVCEPSLMEKATLSDEQVAELARTGLAVEKWFSFPQDIEWAFEDGVLYLLQSRNVKNLSVAEVRAGA